MRRKQGGRVTEANIASQSGIVRVDIADKNELYLAYMPFIANGGLFIAQEKLGNARYDMGSDVFLLLHLIQHNERLPVAGKVIWFTPRNGVAQRPPGIGIQFSSQDGSASQSRIETILAGMLESSRATNTL